ARRLARHPKRRRQGDDHDGLASAQMKYRMLVVDDDAEMRRFLRGVLEDEDFAVEAAASPVEAFGVLAKSRPDLVISAGSMPHMSGVSFCRKLKSQAGTAGIPVILMSGAKKDEEEQAAGIEGGADDYIIKPFTGRLLLAKVSAVLRRFDAPLELKEILETEGL